MAVLILRVKNSDGKTLSEASGDGFVDLVYANEYCEGDRIELCSSEKNIHINWQVDDALGKSFVYFTDSEEYVIPFGERKKAFSPKAFSGNLHYIFAEVAGEEVHMYRNLALNPMDQHRKVNVYPHATANVETRSESVFEARNAIDGVRANLSHGEWPYESWGINRQDDAMMKIDFGRAVRIDKIILYTRADLPHDNWWEEVSFRFSDGSIETVNLAKSERAHIIDISERTIEWLEFFNLIKADDPSPFPALTQIEVYGRVV